MISKVTHLDFEEIPQLSTKDKAYQSLNEAYQGYFKYEPKIEAFSEVIEKKKKHKVDRSLLVSVLKKQYQGHSSYEVVKDQIDLLEDENTFTITTAHQPVFLLGPLYMVYKIISTVRLCKELKAQYSDYNFVPIFVSGGEDHDHEEIATLHLFNKDFTWNTDQTGSVGRMKNDGVSEVVNNVVELFGSSPFANELAEIIQKSLNDSTSYGNFNTNLYKALFSDLGVVVINMDDAQLKEPFLPLAIEEVEKNISYHTVRKAQSELEDRGIKEQAHVREINLFLMDKGSRHRIIKEESGDYTIGDKALSKEELIAFLKNNYQNISPNVVLRPIYQEIILPNLAYVGGGGEIAYWLERLHQFEAFEVPFPMLIRRNSVLTANKGAVKNMSKLGLSSVDFFQELPSLIKNYVRDQSEEDFSLKSETEQLQELFKTLSIKAKLLDQSLEKYVLAEGAKQEKALQNISNRLMKVGKAQNEVQLKKIENVKNKLFPSGKLQERYDSFIPFYLRYGKEWFQTLVDYLNPLDKRFIILEE